MVEGVEGEGGWGEPAPHVPVRLSLMGRGGGGDDGWVEENTLLLFTHSQGRLG